MLNPVKLIFEDMAYATKYIFLEEGKDDEELNKIAKKKGMVLPSPDLAIFKGRYAFADRQNKNKCTLPKNEVEKAVDTLIGKAVDIDHLRKSVVGHWIDAYLDGNDIITYGAFLKSNFSEEYANFKEKMEKGKVKISFEAWGNREYKGTGYDLRDIHFAGGALLDNEDPAFEDAEVLEFAKVIETGEDIEEAKLDFNWDINNIARVMYSHTCPTCKQTGWQDVQNIDFENSKIKHKCLSCGEITETDMTPTSVIKKRGKKPKPVNNTGSQKELDKKMINKDEGGKLKMEEKIKELEAALAKAIEESKLLKAKVDEFEKTESAKVISAKEAEIVELNKKIEAAKATSDELVKKTDELAKITKERDEYKAKIDEIEKAKKDALIKSRRDELGEEIAKTMKDEEILDEVKFENAKLKKENDELKKANPEKAKEMISGSKDKDIKLEVSSLAKGVQESAWGKEEVKK
jgi:hypothetical protein